MGSLVECPYPLQGGFPDRYRNGVIPFRFLGHSDPMPNRIRAAFLTGFVLACGPVRLSAAEPKREQPPAFFISPEDCRALVGYTPAPDVEYKPGVDAQGRRVAPADLPGGMHVTLPDAFPVGINVYVGQPGEAAPPPLDPAAPSSPTAPSSAAPSTGPLYAPEAQIGEVAVVRTPTGYELYFNGEPMSDPLAADIRNACAEWNARQPR